MRSASVESKKDARLTTFGWLAGGDVPPPIWDLRRRGWALCRPPARLAERCTHPLLLDVRACAEGTGIGAIVPAALRRRTLVLNVEDSSARAGWLARGFADALHTQLGLDELAARAGRVAAARALLPRRRQVGPLTLDLFHRDARHGVRWLSLHPREFGVLWRLADDPGQRVTRRELLRDVWRIHHEPDTNSVEVHVSRLRSKLAGAGCDALIETVAEGGYRLAARWQVTDLPAALCAAMTTASPYAGTPPGGAELARIPAGGARLP